MCLFELMFSFSLDIYPDFLILEKSRSYQMPGWVVGPGKAAQECLVKSDDRSICRVQKWPDRKARGSGQPLKDARQARGMIGERCFRKILVITR